MTGFMGVGKSSVARHLSYMLGRDRAELDSAIERSQNRSIAEIIDADGIAEFRRIESEELGKMLSRDGWAILSLGGGTWTIPENRDLIREHNLTTVWLESTIPVRNVR